MLKYPLPHIVLNGLNLTLRMHGRMYASLCFGCVAKRRANRHLKDTPSTEKQTQERKFSD